MLTAFEEAIKLILSGDKELMSILLVTAKMSIQSSLISLLAGVIIGVLLGACDFKGKSILIIVNRTLMSMPPVVCGLIFYLFFSGVGVFRSAKLLFTVTIMVYAQIVLITPIVISNIESYVTGIAGAVKESARGLGLSGKKTFFLLCNECTYQIFATYLLALSRSVAEVGAVSMVGGAIAWKTNVMTTAIMEYTNKGNFSMGISLGIILLVVSLLINAAISIVQRKVSL